MGRGQGGAAGAGRGGKSGPGNCAGGGGKANRNGFDAASIFGRGDARSCFRGSGRGAGSDQAAAFARSPFAQRTESRSAERAARSGKSERRVGDGNGCWHGPS